MHEVVVQVGQQARVEGDVLIQVGGALARLRGHDVHELPQVRVRGSFHGAREGQRDPQVEGVARFDDGVQGLDAVGRVEGGAQDEGFDQRLHRHVAHVGSGSLADRHDVERLESA